MPRLEFDKIGERYYETGIDQVVYYSYTGGKYTDGEAWNGVTNLTENKTGAESNPLYADNTKYLTLRSLEEYGLTIECYTYPTGFEKANGMAEISKGIKILQQARSTFGIAFRTIIGNDTEGESLGYKYHLVYGCSASPSEESNATVNDSPEPKTMSFEIATTPVSVTGFKPTACVVIDTRDFEEGAIQNLEKKLYGDEENKAELPLPDELASILVAA